MNDSECPSCGSTDITGGFVETGESQATQACYCNECPASWVNGYVLDSQHMVREPKEAAQ